jgi:hypothetical protein
MHTMTREVAGLDPRELQRTTGRRAPVLLAGCDEPLRRKIGPAAVRFSAERNLTRRTAAAFALAFLDELRRVPYGPSTVADALFSNPRVGAPALALLDVLLALLEAGDVRSTLIKQRDELDAAIAKLDLMTRP